MESTFGIVLCLFGTVSLTGIIFLAGEEWDAMSQVPIPVGQRVRVVRTILEVEKK
jgi:membrane-bound ClpP family serine protease